MDLAIVFREGDSVLVGIFGILIAMSVVTWYLILIKAGTFYQLKRKNRDFLNAFWEAGQSEQAETIARQHDTPLSRLANAAIAAAEQFRCRPRLGNLDEYLVRALRNGINRENASSASGMTLLASIGSTAPFIGLFGTVWGIYHALITIAESGNASMEMVAGPLGEALVATAAGLAAAIPAVLAYNAFQRASLTLSEDLDGFAHDLHAQLLHSLHDDDTPSSNDRREVI